MKLLLSIVALITVANAASPNGSFIRSGSSADDSADMAAALMVPDDIFSGLEISSNNWTPQEYCPTGSQYNRNGLQWPPEAGCYPG
jgi:hypothetical protein